MTENDLITEDKRRELAKGIYTDSMWLINMVENLLSVSRIENGSMNIRLNTESMNEVIEEAVKHVENMLGTHHLTVKNCDDVLLARMDARLIVQVIINLVDNAVKYSPDGSDIMISSGRDGDRIYVSVADHGEGVKDEEKSRIFDMFYTSTPGISDGRRSLGLGLSLCRAIIQAHKGNIYVTDNKPQGAVFTFTLPSEEMPND